MAADAYAGTGPTWWAVFGELPADADGAESAVVVRAGAAEPVTVVSLGRLWVAQWHAVPADVEVTVAETTTRMRLRDAGWMRASHPDAAPPPDTAGWVRYQPPMGATAG